MIIANKEILDDFVQSHAQAAKPLNKWVEDVEAAQWRNHAELKAMLSAGNNIIKEERLWKS